MTRYVDAAAVAALGPAAAVRAVTDALRDGLDPAADPPRGTVGLSAGHFLLMPAEAGASAGVKVATVAPGNPAPSTLMPAGPPSRPAPVADPRVGDPRGAAAIMPAFRRAVTLPRYSGRRKGHPVRSTTSDKVRFLRAFVAHPRQVGAVLPTSARAVADMLDLADLASARLVVELGSGTGSHTGHILDRLGPDARLVAFEIDPGMAAGLRARLPDPRLRVVTGSAADVVEVLAGDRPEVVVSALPFTSLPADLGKQILLRTVRVLAPGGALLVLQYSPLLARQLHRLFASVTRKVSLRNVPPAFLYACRDPRDPG